MNASEDVEKLDLSFIAYGTISVIATLEKLNILLPYDWSHPILEAKQGRVWLILGWETIWSSSYTLRHLSHRNENYIHTKTWTKNY